MDSTLHDERIKSENDKQGVVSSTLSMAWQNHHQATPSLPSSDVHIKVENEEPSAISSTTSRYWQNRNRRQEMTNSPPSDAHIKADNYESRAIASTPNIYWQNSYQSRKCPACRLDRSTSSLRMTKAGLKLAFVVMMFSLTQVKLTHSFPVEDWGGVPSDSPRPQPENHRHGGSYQHLSSCTYFQANSIVVHGTICTQ